MFMFMFMLQHLGEKSIKLFLIYSVTFALENGMYY